MAIIKKKTWPREFETMKSGEKRFDFRVADFDIKDGDILILEEWDPETKKYTGRKIEKKVNKVFKFNLDQFRNKEEIEENGFYVIQF